MKFICRDCSWTGSREETVRSGNDYYCPWCDGEVDVDDREPDPLNEANADYIHDGMAAVRGQL